MESKLKALPVTILDFMGILLPGLVWLLLVVITLQFASIGYSDIVNSPFAAIRSATSKTDTDISWTPILLGVTLAALIVGYALKPIAMRIAESLAFLFFKRRSKFRRTHFKRLQYPFKHFYKRQDYHRQVYTFIRQELQCSPYKLPGHQPFSTAKRYLRLMAPPLWEESERMEAEVRMTAALFLASTYSLTLSSLLLGLKGFGFLSNTSGRNVLIWALLSFASTVVFAESFNYLRFREVGYTYVNALIAFRFKNGPPGTSA